MTGPEVYPLPGLRDPVSALSHFLAAITFFVLGVRLLRRGRGDALRLAFLRVYAGSCVLLMVTSGAYHTVAVGGAAHGLLLRLDHGLIFVLIAGTFTAAHGLLFRGAMRWGPLALVWSAALAGVTLKTAYFEQTPEWLGLSFYLALGWLGAVSGCVLWARYGFDFTLPLLLGGIAYSVGAVADFNRWPNPIPGVVNAHELFHLAVVAGALFHWSFVWRIADGSPPPEREVAPRPDAPLA